MSKKINFTFIYNSFKDSGKKLLIEEKDYINNMTKMPYICSCGNKSFISWINFKKGVSCRSCGNEKLNKIFKKDFNLIYNEYIKYNCKILIEEKDYINGHTKIPFLCLICENKSYNTFNNFYSGHRCKYCSNKIKQENTRLKFQNIFFEELKNDRCIILDIKYIDAHKPIKYICNNGHTTSINWNNYKQGKRCKQCFYINNTGENHCNFKGGKTRTKRSEYLSFDQKKICLLSDDPSYTIYLQEMNKEEKNKYSVDHIFPRIAFIDNNFDKIYDKYFIKRICNLRENLRIITNKENSEKRGKYNPEEFMEWFNLKLKEIK